jgi:hypothetical protein
MTEEQRYKIATLAGEVARLQRICEHCKLTNLPSDPIEAERVYINYKIAETDWRAALLMLQRAQDEVVFG